MTKYYLLKQINSWQIRFSFLKYLSRHCCEHVRLSFTHADNTPVLCDRSLKDNCYSESHDFKTICVKKHYREIIRVN